MTSLGAPNALPSAQWGGFPFSVPSSIRLSFPTLPSTLSLHNRPPRGQRARGSCRLFNPKTQDPTPSHSPASDVGLIFQKTFPMDQEAPWDLDVLVLSHGSGPAS